MATRGNKHAEKHGHRTRGYHSPTYISWKGMAMRVKNRAGYSHVSVSQDWSDFRNFLRDMGERPEGMTLDRIDSKGGYNKENCRWASHEQQQNNRKNNVIIEGKSLQQWARHFGVTRRAIASYIERNGQNNALTYYRSKYHAS